MTQQQPPRRYATGGFTGRGDPAMTPRRDTEHLVPRELADRMQASARAMGLDAGMASVVVTIAVDATLEAAARAATLGMIREFGVTLPLRAFRALPKPLQRIEALVLDKLEGVAQHLGAP